MELRHPLILLILLCLSILSIYFIKGKHKIQFTNGSKIANTDFIKNTDYFKSKLKKYNIIIKIINICCITSILCSIILISRISIIETNDTSEYNRDIFLCMDVSSSVDELNKELVENLKNTVKSLKGERFGISIFNTSSVTLVPLTDDYEYILTILDKIKESIEVNNTYDYDSYLNNDYFYLRNYIISGTLENVDTKGSSLIGDGLASCVYSFSNLNEERTRIIILSTDNDLAGKPLITLSKAADISKSKSIKVFGIGTSNMKVQDRKDFKNAVEKTGGKFYEHNTSTVKNIVDDIEKTSKSLLKNQIEKSQIDIPQIPFIILLISTLILLILNRKVIK